MDARVHISLLGRFAVEVDGTPIPDAAWRLRKSRSVLKVLALAPGRALHPELLQSLLWADRDPASAGNNLRQAVYHARRALTGAGADGAEVLASRGDLVIIAPEVELDVDAFERAAARAEASGAVGDIEAAVAAYTGELLPEDRYDDWCAERRRLLAERHVALLLALAGTRDPGAATEVLHRAILADPLNEQAHRALIRAYAASGRRPQAVAQYDLLRQTLQRELAADPEPDTRALYRELLTEGAPEPAAEADELAASEQAPVLVVRPQPARHNLPWQPQSFVGRRRELEELDRLLETRRLVTLTGTGGCGKTRLAFELARRRVDRHRDGAWAIELAGLADPALVGQATAAALGLDLRADEPPERSLARHLAERELLLVLDNCEHLLAACTRLVETLLAGCPDVAILATSREPLHLPGEVDWRVPSMTMLDTEAISDVAELAAADAVELFCDRALSANPRFRLSVANAQAVADICFRVDGLPLAIELAAARTTALSPTQIAERLRDGLAVLRATRAGGLTRQQTLEGTLDWSHDMLADDERALFRRLSLFAGGFELEAAEAVCAGDGLAGGDILDLLAGLVDKSLVGVDDAGESYRYRLLEPVRQYAAQRLRSSGEAAPLVERHADWYAGLTDEPGGRVTDEDPRWIDRLDPDHDNLRAALAWLIERRPERALAMAAGMTGLWLLHAHLREGSRWLDRALEAGTEPTLARADALHARQALERRRPRDYDVADALSTERIAIHDGHGDRRGECLAVLDLADGRLLRGQYDEALALCDQAGVLASELDDAGLDAAIRERIGLTAAWRTEFDAAHGHFDAALALCEAAPAGAPPSSAVISLGGFFASSRNPDEYPAMRLEETTLHFRRLPPREARASIMSHRAYLLIRSDDCEGARDELNAALEIVRASRDDLDAARLLAQRGTLESRAGDLDAAVAWIEASLDLRMRLREHRGILLTLATLAVVTAERGDRERAFELLERARRMAEEAVDGPGMGGVLLARAEIDRKAGDHEKAREAIDTALRVFYGMAGLVHYASWMQLQHAWLSLEVGDLTEAERRLGIARAGFTDSVTPLALDHCAALDARLRAANGLLTGSG
ncbi:MAG TPA: BTAD domain-containing putative transcriptional regulator [Thermoleophilaceae bacterium]|nr:BTAD domain-containing putative transcriptional regulator [Thermoleophilaceae bacterium]